MKLLKCKLCGGEVDIISGENSINKTVKCRKCGYSNEKEGLTKKTEIIVIRKKIDFLL